MIYQIYLRTSSSSSIPLTFTPLTFNPTALP